MKLNKFLEYFKKELLRIKEGLRKEDNQFTFNRLDHQFNMIKWAFLEFERCLSDKESRSSRSKRLEITEMLDELDEITEKHPQNFMNILDSLNEKVESLAEKRTRGRLDLPEEWNKKLKKIAKDNGLTKEYLATLIMIDWIKNYESDQKNAAKALQEVLKKREVIEVEGIREI